MMDYQKLLTLGQEEMVDLYIEGAKAAEDFAFSEEEKRASCELYHAAGTAGRYAAEHEQHDD